jgi:hypothetical protein
MNEFMVMWSCGVRGKHNQSFPDDITAAELDHEGIVPTLQNIVATVNLDCHLNLKIIALVHARNAEYNTKVGTAF